MLRVAPHWNNYAPECDHEDFEGLTGECSGYLTPYYGEQDSWGWEVIGFCQHHAQQFNSQTSPVECDGCGVLSESLAYSVPMLGMVCPACKKKEY